MAKRYLATLGLLATLASPLHAAVDMVKLRQAEKVSIALTGKPLSADLRKKFIDEQITLDALADQLSKSPDFVEYFAQFWTKLLGMQSPIDVYALKNTKGNAFQGIFSRTNWNGLGTSDEPGHNVAYLTKYIESHGKGPMEIGITQCADAPLIVWANAGGMVAQLKRAAVDGFGADTQNPKPIQAGTKALWQQILTIAQETSPTCEDSVVTVKPWCAAQPSSTVTSEMPKHSMR
ncbi:MAG: hypothetical protein EOP07_16515 [Proteobacteria bacterium]|nr:MAG: hypothetical protein EOP07_16515 [Pseudomonadota bacterium]